MTTRRHVLQQLGATALVATTTRAWAQGYPERPITFICPWPARRTAASYSSRNFPRALANSTVPIQLMRRPRS